MKFTQMIKIEEDSKNLVKEIISSEFFKALLDDVRNQMEKKSLDSQDYESIRKKVANDLSRIIKQSL